MYLPTAPDRRRPFDVIFQMSLQCLWIISTYLHFWQVTKVSFTPRNGLGNAQKARLINNAWIGTLPSPTCIRKGYDKSNGNDGSRGPRRVARVWSRDCHLQSAPLEKVHLPVVGTQTLYKRRSNCLWSITCDLLDFPTIMEEIPRYRNLKKRWYK